MDETQDLARGIEAGRFDWPLQLSAAVGGWMKCRRQTTRPYWTGHVFNWATGRTHAVHLGRAERLTPEYLDERAAALAAQIRDFMPSLP